MKQKYDELETQTRHHAMLNRHEEYLIQMLNKELGWLNTLFTSTKSKAVDNIKAVTKSQRDTIGTFSEEAVETCTNICTRLNSRVEMKSDELIKNIIHKLNKAEIESFSKNTNDWSLLSEKVKSNQTALLTANATAIKNTKILTTKLSNTKEPYH